HFRNGCNCHRKLINNLRFVENKTVLGGNPVFLVGSRESGVGSRESGEGEGRREKGEGRREKFEKKLEIRCKNTNNLILMT
ncbi:MAG: hypothetical protein M3R27_16245, partial [Bacteroidota bacterium]|nr:hypothetical protein [Bacteroidota bacterium]